MLKNKNPDTSRIDQEWPTDELESVKACPYCTSTRAELAYSDVQDWSFYAAAGKWTYWNCVSCEALYLNPRPTESSIGKAYSTYYTHSASMKSILEDFKTRLKNECFYHWVKADLAPRLHIPRVISFIFLPLKKILQPPFELFHLSQPKKGKLLDVGCGSGNTVLSAKQLGWDAIGLEIDPRAVLAAKQRGLQVIEGDFRELKKLKKQFDCIVCSHVLEHVHFPLELLQSMTDALKPDGVLLLSLPNSKSHVREEFGANWRGLEAPRHLGIPSFETLTELLVGLNYENIHQTSVYNLTVVESIRIQKRQLATSFKTKLVTKIRLAFSLLTVDYSSDFNQISAKLKS